MKVVMTLDKETKGTVRYAGPGGDEPSIPTLYVPKETLLKMGAKADAWPERLQVTVEL